MAKKEKVLVKGFGLISFVIAVALFVLFNFASGLLSADGNEVFGFSFALLKDIAETPEIVEVMFDSDSMGPHVIFGFMFIFLELILVIILAFKTIFLFFGLFGFIGKKDAKVVAKKLAKYTKSALGGVATVIFGLLIFACDDGVLSEDFGTLTLYAGIAFGVMYVLVRFYRWFIASKRPILDCVFDVVKDLVFIGSLIILISFINVGFLADFKLIQTYFYVDVVEGIMQNQMIGVLMAMVVSVFQFFIITSIMRKTLRLLPFNNYKRSAYGKLKGGFIAYFVITVIMSILALVMGDIIAGTFDTANILPLVLDLIVMVLPQLLAMVAVCVACLIEEQDNKFAYPLSTVAKLQAKELEEQAQQAESAE